MLSFAELSTDSSSEISTAYPQVIFMLQCFFLVPNCGFGDSWITAEGNRSGNAKAPRSWSGWGQDMSLEPDVKGQEVRRRTGCASAGEGGGNPG